MATETINNKECTEFLSVCKLPELPKGEYWTIEKNESGVPTFVSKKKEGKIRIFLKKVRNFYH